MQGSCYDTEKLVIDFFRMTKLLKIDRNVKYVISGKIFV